MFGAIWAMFSAVVVIKDSISNAIINSKEREKSLRNNEAFWYKTDGCARLHSNGHKVMTTNLDNGDYVLKDIQTQKILRNYSKEESDKIVQQQYKLAKEKNRSTYCCWYDRFSRKGKLYTKYCEQKISGSRFKDFKTGDIYVIRKFYKHENPYETDVSYYININTNKVVRPIDSELKRFSNIELLSLEEYIEKYKKEMKKRYFKLSEEQEKELIDSAIICYKKRHDMDQYVHKKLYGSENFYNNIAETQEMIYEKN